MLCWVRDFNRRVGNHAIFIFFWCSRRSSVLQVSAHLMCGASEGLRVKVLGEEGRFKSSEESYTRCNGIGLMMPRFLASRQYIRL